MCPVKNKILHITPHLGGGVGSVLLNWVFADSDNHHAICTLDYANEFAKSKCREMNIELYEKLCPLEKISFFDIVVVHFWNHPLLYDFLIRTKLPPLRLIFWAHTAGHTPPYVFNNKLFDYADKFVFTTSLSEKYVLNKKNTCTIFSTSGVERFSTIKRTAHEEYVAGYVGTVEYAKMHPEYVQTLAKTNVDKVIVAGGDSQDEFAKFADNRFIFTGKINNVEEIYSQCDIFAYLLNPSHYGTAEQVLQEAMAAGIPPIVLNNPCETSIVKHLETGLIASNLDEYVEFVNLLKVNTELRQKLSTNARKYAIENFSLSHLITSWNKLFEEVLKSDKKERNWLQEKTEYDSYDVFLESLGEYSKLFTNQSDEEIREMLKQTNWCSKTKATPKQYYSYLGGERLQNLLNLYS